MKKYLMSLVVVMFAVASVGAFTETLPPASAVGTVAVSNGYDWSLSSGTAAPLIQLPIKTAAQIIAYTPVGVGQLTYCSNCAAGTVCVSSGTGVGALVIVSTGAYFNNRCQ